MKEHSRVALVTGVNKGIGLEIARRLGDAGIHVLVGARNRSLGEAAAAELVSEGCSAEYPALAITGVIREYQIRHFAAADWRCA